MAYRDIRPHRHDAYAGVGGIIIETADFSDSLDIDRLLTAAGTFDANPGSRIPRQFIVFTAGTLKVDYQDGSTITYASGELIVGMPYSHSIIKIYTTGTTVTKIGIYW